MAKTQGQAAYETDIAARPTYDDGSVRKTWEHLGEIERLSWQCNPTPRFTRSGAIEALEALNVEICELAGAGHPDATPEQLAAYDRIIAERAEEVRAADAAARDVRGTEGHRHYIDGIEVALQRAIDAPRTGSGPGSSM